MKAIILFLSVFALFSCTQELVSPNTFSNNPRLTAQDLAVDSIFNMHRAGLNTVGVSVGILRDGVESFYGYGETAKGNGVVPDRDTYFEIGSVTKVFTAIAIVKMLEDEGKSIDTPIRSYLPGSLPPINRGGIEVTFKHILTHTSGLPYMPNNLGLRFYTNTAQGWRDYDNEKLFSALKNGRLLFTPFSDFTYSNTGFGTLGVILERHYQKDYGEVLSERVMEPLGLSATTAYFEKTNLANWAVGYRANGSKNDYWKTLNALDGAGVLKSNARDMLAFAQGNINIVSGPLESSLTACQNVYTDFERETAYDITVNCLGWFLYKNKQIDNQVFLFHNGGTGGFNSEFFINPERRSALIVLFNTDGKTEGRQGFITDLLRLISK